MPPRATGRMCCVGGCSNRNSEAISLHRFPRDPIVKLSWLKQVGPTRRQVKDKDSGKTGEFTPNDGCRVCSFHFRADDFESQFSCPIAAGAGTVIYRRKKQLKQGAVPSIFGKVCAEATKKNSGLRCKKRSLVSRADWKEQRQKKVALEMPFRCAMGGCGAVARGHEITLFRLPSRDKDAYNVWKGCIDESREMAGAKPKKKSTHTYVCSKHFDSESFEKVNTTNFQCGYSRQPPLRLKEHAVPSVNLGVYTLPDRKRIGVDPVVSEGGCSTSKKSRICPDFSNGRSNPEAFEEKQNSFIVIREGLTQEEESKFQLFQDFVLRDNMKVERDEITWEQPEAIIPSQSQHEHKTTQKENPAEAFGSPQATPLMTLEEANAIWEDFAKRAPREFYSKNNIAFLRSINSGFEAPHQAGDATRGAAGGLPLGAGKRAQPSTREGSAVEGEREDVESETEREREEEEVEQDVADSDGDYKPDLGDLTGGLSSSGGNDDDKWEEVKKGKKCPRTEKQCEICEKVVMDLSKHMKFVHGGKNLLCPHCGERFRYYHSLNAHIRRHTGDLFYCDQCPKSFSSKKVVDAHIAMVHTPAKHACALCPRKFSISAQLTQHVKLVHDKVREFLCPDCGKVFGTQKGLKRHSLTHSGERNFECNLCGAMFNQNSNLKTHVRSHAKNPDFMKKKDWYPCTLCEVRCGNKKGLRTHLKSHDVYM